MQAIYSLTNSEKNLAAQAEEVQVFIGQKCVFVLPGDVLCELGGVWWVELDCKCEVP